MAAKYMKLEEDYKALLGELNTLKCKLECKTDSLLILSHELSQCRSERDQYKLMADQLRERYSALKRRVEGWGPSLLGVYDVRGLKCEREQSLVQLLCELKEQNKALKFEADDLKQRLFDAQGDVKILREEFSKKRSGSLSECSIPDHVSLSEKTALVKQLETQRLKVTQLTRDLQAVLDEKEDSVTARDAYRHKFERLNQQLNYMLRGDQQTTVDIDGVLMENRYLLERIKQVQEEKAMMAGSLSKCKAIIDKKRSKGGLKLSAITAGLAISAKQVEQLLQNNPFLDLSSKSSNSADFRNLIMTLLETLSDKSIALSHQRKTNKILGNRVSELEQKIKSMEVSSLLRFNDSHKFSYLLHDDELAELKQSENTQTQSANINNAETDEFNGLAHDEQSVKSDEQSSEFSLGTRTHSGFSDLDILPTKDYSPKNSRYDRQNSTSSCSHYSDSKDNSPLHNCMRSFHSDTESSPLRKIPFKPPDPVASRSDISALDIDDLPPKLQKLLIAALAELEENGPSENSAGKSGKSPQHSTGSGTKQDDPSC